VLYRNADGASHRGLAAAAERKAVDRRDHRLAEILDEIEDLLSEAAGPFSVNGSRLRHGADVGTGDKGFVARSRQNDAADGRVAFRILECGRQVLPGCCVKSVEHLGPVDRYIGDCAPCLVEDIRKRWRRNC